MIAKRFSRAVEVLDKLARTLDVDVSEFFYGSTSREVALEG